MMFWLRFYYVLQSSPSPSPSSSPGASQPVTFVLDPQLGGFLVQLGLCACFHFICFMVGRLI